MNLDRVTITGADNTVEPHDLLRLSEEFPFVEWGILASASNTGSPRFPTLAWMHELRKANVPCNLMNLSLHLCGRWVRLLLIGEVDPIIVELMGGYGRIQLNFHAENNACEPDRCLNAFNHLRCRSLFQMGLQFIFQLDEAHGNEHLTEIMLADDDRDINAVGLFDVSGGAGVLPASWPKPYYLTNDGKDYAYHGYAGGLGPDNLAEQIPLIAKAANGCRFWIDMETRVRSEDDQQFDLDKVRRCLEIAAPFVTPPPPPP